MSALKGIDLINAIEQQKYDVLVLNTDDKADDYNSCDEDNWAMSVELLRLAKFGEKIEEKIDKYCGAKYKGNKCLSPDCCMEDLCRLRSQESNNE